VGLAAIDDHLKIVFRSAKHPRYGKPELKENEAWLRQMFWNHFESKYAVEGEGVVPRLREGLRKYSTSRALLGSIDLFLLPKGSTITDVAFNQDKSESIGIEVKYKIKSENKLKKIIKEQLVPYAESGALTRLYLAIDKKSDSWIIEKLGGMSNRKFGVLVYDDGDVVTALEAPKLELKYDFLAFAHSTGREITVYEIGKARPVKTISTPNHMKGRELLKKELKFYCIIYARLSWTKQTHLIDYIPNKEPLNDKLS